jgi:streptogramin lyase
MFSVATLVVALIALWFSYSANNRSSRAESRSSRAQRLGQQAAARAQAENVVVRLVPGQAQKTPLIKISNYGLLPVEDALIVNPHASGMFNGRSFVDDDAGSIAPCTQRYARIDQGYGKHPEVVFRDQDGTQWVGHPGKQPVAFVPLKGTEVELDGMQWKTRPLACQRRSTG